MYQYLPKADDFVGFGTWFLWGFGFGAWFFFWVWV